MKHYTVTFTVKLNDTTSHPRKWVPDALWEVLEPGEDIDNWMFIEKPDPVAVDVEAKWIEP